MAGANCAAADIGWGVYHGDPGGSHFSQLDQVNRHNVQKLEVAWVFDTQDAFGAGPFASEMQSNPIVVNGMLYTLTPRLRAIALDAASGALRWSFDPNAGHRVDVKRRSRGVAYWARAGKQRIYFGTGHYLYALDAGSGKPAVEFGGTGRVDLRTDLGRDPAAQSVFLSSPPVIFEDLVIVGGAVSETLPSSPGHIRAYDARTGALRWTFRTIPWPGEPGYDSWPADAYLRAGGANNWAGMVIDERRGLLFVPTGSAAYDFFGADRTGDNLYANSLVAVDARTGQRVWHRQFVRHDLWDRDLPAPPVLVTVRRGPKRIDALAQVTKSGHVFVLAREDGHPLFPLTDIVAPGSDVPGEIAAATQLVPVLPAPFVRQRLTEATLTQRSPAAHEAVAMKLRELRNRGPFDPPSLQGTIILPGLDGGAEWGGAGVDPATNLLYVNANEMAWILQLVDNSKIAGAATRASLYATECGACHGADPRGSPGHLPSLLDVGERLTKQEILLILLNGAGRMPSFERLGLTQADAIAEFLVSGQDAPLRVPTATALQSRFTLNGYSKFLDPEGYPAIAPPWGSLTAIDLNSGAQVWQVPLGEYPELLALGMPPTGSENYGGPIVTAGGLLFIAATMYDNKFRAFDKATGKLLWTSTLPAAGHATPATYSVNGRQFIVIAAGGGKHPKARAGSCYIAFALPEKKPARRQEQAPWTNMTIAANQPVWTDARSCLAALH
jgi:quinoprotein glucose dehydrogenase